MWNEQTGMAFSAVKEAPWSVPDLAYPQPGKHFITGTDIRLSLIHI